VGLINRELKVGFSDHEKDGSVYEIDRVRRDKSRETFRRVVTRGRNILLKWLLKGCEDGTELSKLGTTPYTRNGVGINPLKDGSPNWDNSTEKISSAYCFPGNDAGNACWRSLASPLSNRTRERWVVKHTITETSASAQITVVALHPVVFGLSLYFHKRSTMA
jgi:hypothetical protein